MTKAFSKQKARPLNLLSLQEQKTTLGDGLATVAALLAIEEAQQEQSDTADNKNMQKQIDYLSSEMVELKKQIKRLTPPRR